MKKDITAVVRKFGLLLLALPLVLSSCYKDDPNPSLTADITFKFTITRVGYDGIDIQNPVKTIQLFLKDEQNRIVYGPINVTKSEATTSESAIMSFTGTASVPFGRYTTWLWCNVSSPELYSLDKFTVNIKDNILNSDLFAGQAREVYFDQENMTINWTLTRLTGRINVTNSLPGDITPQTLFISNVAKSVDANLDYFGQTDMENNNATITTIPSVLYMFPSKTNAGSEFHLTYMSPGPVQEVSITTATIVAAEEIDITFEPEPIE